ncbi:MAG: MFS transporter [Solirubrobacterales bacterium]
MTGPRLSTSGRSAIALAAALALADASIVTLGLPSILVELHSTVEGVALVLGVYTAALAASLPVATRLADRIGPPRLASWGVALFAAASLACGAMGSLPPLLVLRAVQAAGGAAVLVAAFELLGASEPGPGRRLWVAASVFGAAAGPALGGALTEAFDWRAIFLAQTPLVIPALAVAVSRARRDHGPWGTPEAGPPLPARPTIALALLSAALTAVIFLVVLLLVAGWSVEPLRAAIAVSVLPVSALLASRLPGEPQGRAAAGCLLVAGGIGCLALLPGASAWWTVAPQVMAGAGMGMALPALTEELIGERNRREAARLLVIRHLGIVLALATLAPTISSGLESSIASAREQGTAAMLDSSLPPETKIELAPQLLGDVDTDDPRAQLQRSAAEARGSLEGEELADLDRLSQTLDRVITDAVRSAFRIAFVITAALALAAALALLGGRVPRRGALAPAVAACAIAAIALTVGYGIAFARSDRESIELADPCQDRELPDAGGIGGALQGLTLSGLDRAACKFGSGREELLLALFDDELRDRFEAEHGVDPRSPLELGPALLGF